MKNTQIYALNLALDSTSIFMLHNFALKNVPTKLMRDFDVKARSMIAICERNIYAQYFKN